MSWSKVKSGKKPLGWWYHKILCEIGWSFFGGSYSQMYHNHLKSMVNKYRINLYGERI
jgi:hypothetical protein